MDASIFINPTITQQRELKNMLYSISSSIFSCGRCLSIVFGAKCEVDDISDNTSLIISVKKKGTSIHFHIVKSCCSNSIRFSLLSLLIYNIMIKNYILSFTRIKETQYLNTSLPFQNSRPDPNHSTPQFDNFASLLFSPAAIRVSPIRDEPRE